MELIGKGIGNTGAVWVARRIPDGYISGHANQARITTFPLENGKTSISSDNLDKIFDPGIELSMQLILLKSPVKWNTSMGKIKILVLLMLMLPLILVVQDSANQEFGQDLIK